MKIESVDTKHTLGVSDTLAALFIMSMDIYYDTVASVIKEKGIKGTVDEISTKAFKGNKLYVKTIDLEVGEFEISKVNVSSFGIEIFLKGQNDSIHVSYDSIKHSIKNRL